MIRAVFAIMVPLLLPLLVWLLWRQGVSWLRRRRGLAPLGLTDVPVLALVLGGMMLAALTTGLLYLQTSDQGSPPGTPYEPPRAWDANPNAWPVEHPASTPRP